VRSRTPGSACSCAASRMASGMPRPESNQCTPLTAVMPRRAPPEFKATEMRVTLHRCGTPRRFPTGRATEPKHRKQARRVQALGSPDSRTRYGFCRQWRQRRMEPLWSPAVAIGGNQWQMDRDTQPLKQAKTVAVGCDRLPESFHGKEGVDGSSPSEGSAKAPLSGFPFGSTCTRRRMRRVWSRLWSSQIRE
jgi:hypothetical protein